MRVKEILPLLALIKSQRVRLYSSPEGKLIGDFERKDILPAVCGRTVGGLLNASLLCMDANNRYINLYVSTERSS